MTEQPVPHRSDLALVRAALAGDRAARMKFFERYLDTVVACAVRWTRWHPALCPDDAPRCALDRSIDLSRCDCDCLRETVVFIFEKLLGAPASDRGAQGKLRHYRGECALDTWMRYQLWSSRVVPPRRKGTYGYLTLYTDYLRRFRTRRIELPAALRHAPAVEQQVFRLLTRGVADSQVIAERLAIPLSEARRAIAAVRAALARVGWQKYWQWVGSSLMARQSREAEAMAMPNTRDDLSSPHNCLHPENAHTLRYAEQLLKNTLQELPAVRRHILVWCFHDDLSAQTILRLVRRHFPAFPASRRAIYYEIERGLEDIRRSVWAQVRHLPPLTDLKSVLREWDLSQWAHTPAPSAASSPPADASRESAMPPSHEDLSNSRLEEDRT